MAISGSHRAGVYARVAGLERTPHLNGEIGELLRQNEAGRWVVRVRSGLKAVRPENLHPAASQVPDGARRGLGGAAAATAHLLLELARSGGHRALSAAALPTSLLVWILATLAGCYWLHKPLSSPEAVLPGISEMGIAPPARGVYRSGSATAGLLLACTVRLYSTLLLPHLADGAAAGRAAESANMGYVAAAGVAVQGVFTLETGLSVQTLLHFAGAIAFVLGTIWHADASNALFNDLGDTALAVSPVARVAISVRRICSEGLPIMLLMVPVGLQIWQWSSGCESKGGRLQNVIGLAQWALVINIAVFYCTYACDFWVVLESS
eukprot:TRINITY_DN6044_c0_g1_i1.p1 TRINITY_DN6044_c0_g1~~TRINITY_DN6044_c0_g1_i1.p1  ORF type:complete len:350 (+),score=38.04 TRINITY_DN6044_c0_g1_i1:84-1052(+)